MPREHFNADWVFAFTGSVAKIVEEDSPRDIATWPLIRQFNFDAFEWRSSHAVFVLHDKHSGITAGPSARATAPEGLPSEPISISNVLEWQAALALVGRMGPRDAAFVIPLAEGSSVEDDWENHFNEEDRLVWAAQVTLTYRRQHLYLSGWDTGSGFFLPPGYEHLGEACRRFFDDHPNFEQNVFLMTRFTRGSKALKNLDVALRQTLRSNGLEPVRADDKVYPINRDLWDNVCTYMLCCKRGVSVLESRGSDDFNPNVALEYGFMKALNRDVLLFKEVAFNRLVADVVGTLYESFDITDLEATLEPALQRWIRDLGIVGR